MQPTAIGHSPPDFFSSVTIDDPKKKGYAIAGTLPSISVVQKEARDYKKVESSFTATYRKSLEVFKVKVIRIFGSPTREGPDSIGT